MKTAIIYYSEHHGNTKKLVDAIAEKNGVDVFNILEGAPDLSGYDRVGFASGIYFSDFHRTIIEYLRKNSLNKEYFLLYTYGAKKSSYTKHIKSLLKEDKFIGEYGCYGYDTFGPFKLIGGLKKNHPNKEEIDKCVEFYSGL